MLKNTFNTQFDSCDGFLKGETIIKGSVPINRLDPISFQAALREFLESSINSPDDDWLAVMVCNLGCMGQTDIFELSPTELSFGPDGGMKSFKITVGEMDEWSIE